MREPDTVSALLEQEDDAALEAARCRRFIREYFWPVILEHVGRRRPLTILSDGCGVGADVEALCALGVHAIGIDPGPRRLAWRFRTCQGRLLAADGARLPLRDESVDAVLSFGVLDHVGTEARRGYIAEALRVLRPGGAMVLGVIHRLCPIDPFHTPNVLGLRVHGPWDLSSISLGQIRRWCEAARVPVRLEILPLNRQVFAWDGLRSRWWGRRWYPQLMSTLELLFGNERTAFLRRTCLNPFLLVKVTKL